MDNWKEWPVYNRSTGTMLGFVRATRRYLAMLMAERDFNMKPGKFYLGVHFDAYN